MCIAYGMTGTIIDNYHVGIEDRETEKFPGANVIKLFHCKWYILSGVIKQVALNKSSFFE